MPVLTNALKTILMIPPLILGTLAPALSVRLQVSFAFAFLIHQLLVAVLTNALKTMLMIPPLIPGTLALVHIVPLQVSSAFAYPIHQLLVPVLTNALVTIVRILPLVLGAAAFLLFWIEFFAPVLTDARMMLIVGVLAATGVLVLVISGLDLVKVGFGVGKCSDGAQGKECAQKKVFEKHGDRWMVQ